MKNIKLINRISVTAAVCLPIFIMSGCQDRAALSQKKFDEFIQQEFVSAMESDYTTAHVFLQHPENFGINPENIQVSLGTRPDETDWDQVMEQQQKSYDEFNSFDRELLTPQQQDIYDTYKYQMDLTIALNDEKFDYYSQIFGSMSGLQFQLPTLFSDWELRNEQDVKDLVILMSDVKPYVDSALEYTKKQEAQGLLMADLQSVIDYCSGIIEEGENSSVLAAIYENIDALGLDTAAAQMYKDQIKDEFNSSFIPAYEAMRDTMIQLQSGQNNEQGLAHFEYGKAYYELLLQQSIGSTKSVEEIRTMMVEEFENHLMNLQTLLINHMDIMEPLLTGELPQTPYTSYEEILDHIQQNMSKDFPQISDLSYNIRNMGEDMASTSGIAAYFNIPSLDGESTKQMRVNPLIGDISAVSTYTTVAHEGFPGHMYQYAYAYENLESPYMKALSDSSAYVEGYAVYAQYESTKYLEDMDQALLDAYRENELATYCAIILSDIGIHYDGWSLDEFTQYFNSIGFAIDEENAKMQYMQLQANPCAFEPYYVGYHEIAAMKEDAQEALGDLFTDQEFNEALLESGVAPFSVVQRHISDYIERVLPQQSQEKAG